VASNLAAVGFAVTDVDHVKSLVSTAFDRARESVRRLFGRRNR